MSYNKSDGKMKEGHKHTDRSGQTWVIRAGKFERTEYDPSAIRV